MPTTTRYFSTMRNKSDTIQSWKPSVPTVMIHSIFLLLHAKPLIKQIELYIEVQVFLEQLSKQIVN